MSQRFSTISKGSACAAFAVATLGLTTPATFAFDPVPKDEFKMLLQVRGDWSGSYTGEELALDDNTFIFVQSEGGRLHPDGPEYVDMEDHLAQLDRYIDRKLPPDFDGVAILDYEMWPCTLYHNGWSALREERVDQVLAENPSLSPEEALEIAAAEYKVAAQNFFLPTLEKAREKRPNAKWGFFPMTAYLQNPNHPFNPGVNDDVRWINDQSDWLWDAVDVIVMPGYNGWHESEEEHLGIEDAMPDKSGELARIADCVLQRTGRRPLCLQYVHLQVLGWGDSQHRGDWYAPEQVRDTIERVYEGGADGLVFWQRVLADGIESPTEEEFVEVIDTDVRAALEELQLGSFAPQIENEMTLRERIERDLRFVDNHRRSARIFAKKRYAERFDYRFEPDELERILKAERRLIRRVVRKHERLARRELRRLERRVRSNRKDGDGQAAAPGGN